MAEWSSVVVSSLDTSPIFIMPWPTWAAPVPEPPTSILTVAVPTTVSQIGPTMTLTQAASTVTETETGIPSSIATGVPGSSDLDPGSDLRRISVAIVCLSFALGVTLLILLFLAARWYRIRQQKKRQEVDERSSDEEDPTPPEQYERNDLERQAPGIVPPPRSASHRSSVSQLDERNAATDRDSAVSISPQLPTHHAMWSRDV